MTAAQFMAANFLESPQANQLRGVLELAEGGNDEARTRASALGTKLSAVERYALFDAVDALLAQARQQ